MDNPFKNINKKYQIIYADPPWPERGGGKIGRGANRHYRLMKVSEIINLPVITIVAPDSHLYLWVTNNYLESGLDVMRAWGYRYVTKITWVKKGNIGIGQYFRGTTEDCLFGVRGNIPHKTENGKRCQGKTHFAAYRGRHSAKPEEMRKIIKHVSDRRGFNKIELFARKTGDDLFEEEKFEGWDLWGFES